MTRVDDAERLMALHLDELGIKYKRQYMYVEGRRFRADFALFMSGFRQALPAIVLVEVVGGVYSRQAHGSISGVLRDIERLNEATRAGHYCLRFTPDQIASGEAKAFIAELLRGGER